MMKKNGAKTIKFVVTAVLMCLAVPVFAAPKPPMLTYTPGLLKEALAGPMSDGEEIIFTTRQPYDDGHWYANIGYYCEDENMPAYAGNGKPGRGKLFKYNLRTKKLTLLLDTKGGSVRDPQVHYDGEKILFAYRRAGSDFYNLYEIDTSGENLRQITFGDYDDFEPTYMPDGRILFVSTRCNRWVSCYKTQVAIMYSCDAGGGNITQLSGNIEHDNTPWMLPDGRVLYTRWEYVDRSQVDFHHLWAMSPDGTRQTVFYGNMHPRIVMIDAKPIPNSDKIVAIFCPGHGRMDHNGAVTVLTDKLGPDAPEAVATINAKPVFKDPWPFSEDCFLVAFANKIVVMNEKGHVEVVYALPKTITGLNCHEPRPIIKRPREKIIPSTVAANKPTGEYSILDVYEGRNMKGVKRGDIKKLLVLEALPKPANFHGGPDVVSWLGTFNLERVLGTVPVEPDGSAYFEVPANRSLFFVTLDENDMSVKRMQSFTSVVPGESTTCIGCHEERTVTAPANKVVMAMKRPPSKIEPFAGQPDILDFRRDIQPILDENCVSCHNYRKREGKVLLTGDVSGAFCHSFWNLFANLQIADGQNGYSNLPPRSIGSSASRLMDKIDGSHYGVELSDKDWRTVWLWIESAAPYAGTYAALRTMELIGKASVAGGVLRENQSMINNRCNSCHPIGDGSYWGEFNKPIDAERNIKPNFNGLRANHERQVKKGDSRLSPQILFNFTRPKFSPILLGPLAKEAGGYGSCPDVFKDTSDPDYQALLGSIKKAKVRFDKTGVYGTEQFAPHRQYVREMKRFGILDESFDLAADEIDAYQTDRLYWQSLWYQGVQ